MSNPYAALASIYDTIGMSDFAREATPRLVEFAQQQDWLGRRVLDLGCGTGAATRWLANLGYATTAVDVDGSMLETAQRAVPASGLSLTWEQRDIRALDSMPGQFDLALALDVLNELASLRDLEQVFLAVARVLESDKLFVFDLHTIQGLTERGADSHRVIHDSGQLTVIARSGYDHDRQVLQMDYTIFQRASDLWRRSETRRTLRGFPIQATATLLQRCGYDVMTIMTTDFASYEPGTTPAARVFFVARRSAG